MLAVEIAAYHPHAGTVRDGRGTSDRAQDTPRRGMHPSIRLVVRPRHHLPSPSPNLQDCYPPVDHRLGLRLEAQVAAHVGQRLARRFGHPQALFD